MLMTKILLIPGYISIIESICKHFKGSEREQRVVKNKINDIINNDSNNDSINIRKDNSPETMKFICDKLRIKIYSDLCTLICDKTIIITEDSENNNKT